MDDNNHFETLRKLLAARALTARTQENMRKAEAAYHEAYAARNEIEEAAKTLIEKGDSVLALSFLDNDGLRRTVIIRNNSSGYGGAYTEIVEAALVTESLS